MIKPDNSICEYTENEIVSEIAKLIVDKPSIGEYLYYPEDSRDILPRGPRILCSIDAFSVKSIKLPWRSYTDIGWIAVTSSVSDIVSKGGIPHAGFLALGLSCKLTLGNLMELVYGIKEASRHYGTRILGGDTNHSDEDWIAISTVGFTSARKPPSRNGLKPGDYIVATGVYGAMGYVAIRGIESAEKTNWVVKYTKRPVVRMETAIVIEMNYRSISASMDVSDGLGYTLQVMSDLSGYAIELIDTPLVPSELQLDVCRYDVECILKYSLVGGEEYGVVLGVRPDSVNEITKELVYYGVEHKVIGRVLDSPPGVFYSGEKLEIKRFDQFKKWM